jgi:hypothetical protein
MRRQISLVSTFSQQVEVDLADLQVEDRAARVGRVLLGGEVQGHLEGGPAELSQADELAVADGDVGDPQWHDLANPVEANQVADLAGDAAQQPLDPVEVGEGAVQRPGQAADQVAQQVARPAFGADGQRHRPAVAVVQLDVEAEDIQVDRPQ